MHTYTEQISLVDGKKYIVFRDTDYLYEWLEQNTPEPPYRIASFNGYENAITFDV